MANYEQYYQKSMTALPELIKERKKFHRKEWNHLAGTDNYLTSQSLGFIAKAKFSEICKRYIKRNTKTK